MRKSKAVRLSEAQELLTMYSEENLDRDKRARFIFDMISKLEAGKNLSARQRSWLDSLIAEGRPEVIGDKEIIERVTSALQVEGLSDQEVSALRDFRYKLSKGWDLSEKQQAWMNNIIKKSEKILKDGPYTPDDDTVDLLRKCIKLAKGYSSVYWSTHGGTARALENVSRWLSEDGNVDEWSVNKLISSMRSRLRELEDKHYVKSGELVWCRSQVGGQASIGVVHGPPEISERGDVVYPVLAGGSLLLVTRDRIAKRKPKEFLR